MEALLWVRTERTEAEIIGREGERLVGVAGAAAGRIVADKNVVDAKQLSVVSGGRLHGENDVGVFVFVEVEELHLELAGDMRLVVDAVIEFEAVNLDGAVGTRRVAGRHGGGKRSGR